MTPKQKSELKWFIPETAVYAALVVLFCLGVFKLLGHPLELMSKRHKVDYACVALGLMVFQGFVLERGTHAIVSIFRRGAKGSK